MLPTLNFLLPSLYPSTLLDVTFPLASSSTSADGSRDPIVRNLPIKHGDYQAVGSIKRMIPTDDPDLVIVADDAFQISRLSLSTLKEDGVPEVVSQSSVQPRKGATWSGLVHTTAGTITSLSSGQLSFHPASASSSDSPLTRTLPNPVTCIASSSSSSPSIALTGKGQDVSVWDIEQTFASSGMDEDAATGKRKKDVLQVGETWRAKNLPPNHLRLPQPIHHMCLAYLPNSEDLLVSGTRAGTVRRYDVRQQRKPTADWKVAKEGGVACVMPGDENELFFTDQSGSVTALDLRTGKQVYSLPLPSTPHHLFSIPPSPAESAASSSSTSTRIGLASIASDATFRLHATAGVERKGNRGDKEKWKRGVVGVCGGVGGQGIWRGWGEMEEPVEAKTAGGVDGEDGEDDGEDEGEGDEEEMWEGMSVVDEAEDGGEESDSDGGEEQNGKKQRRA